MSEIVDLFRLEDVNKAAAFFDPKKLDHVNAVYLRELTTAEFLERAERWLDPGWDRSALAAVAVVRACSA